MLLLLANIVASGSSFTCTPEAVWDGDGPIWCAEGPKIRLAGIAAREMDGTCKPGHPCPSMPPEQARDQLINLLGGSKGKMSTGHIRVSAPPLTCRSDGSAGGSRTAAWCVTASGVDLSCELVKAGAAARWKRFWRNHSCG